MLEEPGAAGSPAPKEPLPSSESSGIWECQNWMKEHGVSQIRLEFSGYGDEGEVELSVIDPPDAASISMGEGLEPAESWLIDLGDDLLESVAAGWEDNDGGRGLIDIVPDEPARLLLYDRAEEVRDFDTVDLMAQSGLPEIETVQQWMKENDVQRVTISINGYGDQGLPELSDTDPPEAASIPIEGGSLQEFVEFTDQALESGWEDNLGGAGEIEITPDSAVMEFGYREEFYTESEHLFIGAPPEVSEELSP